MPLFGTRDVAEIARDTAIVRGFNMEPLRLPGVGVLQTMFELRQEAIVSLLPPALHPTIPPTIAFVLTSVPSSPAGPFVLAEARVGCRAGARPRGFLRRAYASTAAGAEFLSERWAYPTVAADVEIGRGYDRVRGVVHCASVTVLDVSLRNPEAISGGDIQYLANMNPARVVGADGERLRLVQVDPEFVFQRADRGRPHLDAFDAEAWLLPGADPWWPVSASFATADMELPAIRFVLDPGRPAVEGLERVG